MSVIERECTESLPAPLAHTARAAYPRWFEPLGMLAFMLLDALTVALAFRLAYWARYTAQFGGAIQGNDYRSLTDYRFYNILLVAAIVLAFGVRGLYRLPRGTTFLAEVTTTWGAVTVANAAVLVIVFLQPEFVSSRLFVVYAWGAILLLVALERGVRRLVRDQLWQRGIGVERAVVVGSGPAAQRVMSYLATNNDLGFHLVGFVDDLPVEEGWAIATSRSIMRPQRLGENDALAQVIKDAGISEVVIALPPQAHERILGVITTCRDADVGFQLVPDVFELSLGRVQINELHGVPLISVRASRIRGWNLWIKRGVDILGAASALLVMAIPMLLIALAIRIDTRGPIFIKQTRVGKGGKDFTCYKFRSMHTNAAEMNDVVLSNGNGDIRLRKHKDDPRRTRIGRLIRPTSLDELPQLLNVLIGKMSLVGPRPQVRAEVDHYEPWHHQRLAVTPGITGLWQVSGRSDLTFEEMVRLDIYYAENWSVRLDLEILLRTPRAVLSMRGAY
ncbi:MAG: sugar transferase [Chloroflexota bacterium]|nr:sugar transferase [Chloroflexota bacterium]